MTRGKSWTAQEEADLKTLVESDASVQEIAAKFQKKPGAIIIKCKRLGLNLRTKGYTTTSIPLPRDLPSIEEAMKILAGALKTATKPGIDKTEIQRLNCVTNIAKTYQELAATFAHYREIELELAEMEKQNAQLEAQNAKLFAKENTQNPTPQQHPTTMAQPPTG